MTEITLSLCDLGSISGVTFSHESTFLEQFLQYIGTDQLFLNSKHLYPFPTYFSSLNIAIVVFIREREKEEKRKTGKQGRGVEREKEEKDKERSPNYLFVLEVSTVSGQWCRSVILVHTCPFQKYLFIIFGRAGSSLLRSVLL